MRKFLLSLMLLGSLLGGILPARAQMDVRAELYGLRMEDFPAMVVSLDVFDAQGAFLSGLTSDTVALLEDEQQLQVDSIEEVHPGVQFVVAINPGPAFAIQNLQAVSRYDKIAQALRGWAEVLPADSGDDLSLVANEGPNVAHLASPQDWVNALDTYQPEARTMTPMFEVLIRAVQVAAEPPPQSGMKRAVLFITPLPEPDSLPVLQDLASQAKDLDVFIFVWVVASPGDFNTSLMTAMKDLAIQTGGQFFAFSGDETLPNPEDYLAPLRHVYLLNYASMIRTSGAHSLAARVFVGGGQVTTQPFAFELDVQPPNPIFVSLPAQIVRQSTDERRYDPEKLVPAEQVVEIIIEFPDNHPRPLGRSTLYVDGQISAENTQEPFDTFTWDLGGYLSTGQHLLQVEVVDNLGLSKVTLGLPVTVTVVQPPRGFRAFLSRNSLWLTILAVLLAGGVLVWILFAAGRLRFNVSLSALFSRRTNRDPVTQPVESQSAKPGLRLPWVRRPKPAPAYLVRLKGNGQPVTSPPLPLTGAEITFGTDPVRATHVLDDPSVSPLHACVKQEADGEFLLVDQNSTAGTWVNYNQISGEGCRLKHGDVIHFGKLAFRFMLRKPPERQEPGVLPTQNPKEK